MFDAYTLSVLVFVAILALVFYRDRRNVERQSVLLLRKTIRGRGFIQKLARRSPGTWLVYGMLAVGVGFVSSVFISHYLVSMVVESMFAEAAPPLALVLPSPTSEVVMAPGVLGVPFWYWIVSIFLLVLVHEGSHGIMAAREKVRIKGMGWGLLVVIPLAFVEPDEDQLKREAPMKQLRVFAAGSFGNFVLAGLVIVILAFAFVPAFYAPSGVVYQGLIEGYPAHQANLSGTIVGIDDYAIGSIDDLSAALDEMGPGREITITTESSEGEREFMLTTVENPDDPGSGRGFIGISTLTSSMDVKDGVPFPGAIAFLYGMLGFIGMINLGVGLFNLLPIGPLDGGRMWRILLDKVVPRYSRSIMNGISWALLFVIILLFATAFV